MHIHMHIHVIMLFFCCFIPLCRQLIPSSQRQWSHLLFVRSQLRRLERLIRDMQSWARRGRKSVPLPVMPFVILWILCNIALFIFHIHFVAFSPFLSPFPTPSLLFFLLPSLSFSFPLFLPPSLSFHSSYMYLPPVIPSSFLSSHKDWASLPWSREQEQAPALGCWGWLGAAGASQVALGDVWRHDGEPPAHDTGPGKEKRTLHN